MTYFCLNCEKKINIKRDYITVITGMQTGRKANGKRKLKEERRWKVKGKEQKGKKQGGKQRTVGKGKEARFILW